MTADEAPPRRPPSGQSLGSFQAGGTLREGSLYVERAADEELPAALLRREFCYVLAPRQIGKSSLRVRTSQRLAIAGVRCVTIDLTTIGSRNSSAAEWYYGLLREVAEQLGMPEPEPFWREHGLLSPVHRWSRFLRECVVGGAGQSWPVVIFIDEVDALLSLTEVSRDDFFGSVRAVYNARADDPRYERLTFCLFGVAMASDLIHDETRTPFNVGRGIPLADFSQRQTETFLSGLGEAGGDPGLLLEEVYKWTSGHPYMTQMVCQTLCEEPSAGSGSSEADRVARVVGQLFLRKGRVLEPSLSYAEKWFERADAPTRTAAMLRLYARLRAGERVQSRADDAVQMALRLTGMATERADETAPSPSSFLEVRNRIFADVFDARWVRDQTAKRLVSAPLLRWLESGKRDEFLLGGQALSEAQAWARETADQTREEAEFLDQSERALERQRAKKLNVLFMTEIWKSTANYLLLYVLVDYMERMGVVRGTAALMNRIFFSAIYVSPLLGGLLADRGLGHRRAVSFSIMLLGLGYFVMSVPHLAGVWAGLFILFIGHGLYKPNFTALVGEVYGQEDVRRDSAFIRYYLGLNIGAALGPILVTSLSGYGAMCAAAGVAMVVALLSFQHYPESPEPGARAADARPDARSDGRSDARTESRPDWRPDGRSDWLSGPMASRSESSAHSTGLVALARLAARENDRRRMRALALLILVVAVPFWMAFYAAGDIAELWLNQRTHNWLGLVFTPDARRRISAAQNPIFVVAMMPLMWAVLGWLRQRHKEPPTGIKMAAGMLMLSAALLILTVPDPERGSSLLLFGGYCILSMAELCVVPIGYSLVTELAPKSRMATALAFWFIPMTVGKNLSVELAGLWERHHWQTRSFLFLLALISLGSAVFLVAQMGRLRRATTPSAP